MTHIEFEHHFAEQAERFGIAKIIRQRGEEYAFQSFMLAMSSIVARDDPKPIDEEELDKLILPYVREYVKEHPKSLVSYTDGIKTGFRLKEAMV